MSQTILEVLNKKHDIIKAQVQRALPKHLSAERMIRILTTEINKKFGASSVYATIRFKFRYSM